MNEEVSLEAKSIGQNGASFVESGLRINLKELTAVERILTTNALDNFKEAVCDSVLWPTTLSLIEEIYPACQENGIQSGTDTLPANRQATTGEKVKTELISIEDSSNNESVNKPICSVCGCKAKICGAVDVKCFHMNMEAAPCYVSVNKCAKTIKMDPASTSKSHCCRDCTFKTTHQYVLTRHVNMVHLKKKRWKCPLCVFESVEKSALKTHKQTAHSKSCPDKFTCDACDYTSPRLFHLQRHYQRVHLKLKTLACDLCEFKTDDKSTLNRHINCVHLKLKTLQCSKCNYRTARKCHLYKHEKTHSNHGNFNCGLCKYKSRQESRLDIHMKKIHSVK